MLRLTEQASVLKGEIRRLERNQERENAISNMEYLKNIVYKVRHNIASDLLIYFFILPLSHSVATNELCQCVACRLSADT